MSMGKNVRLKKGTRRLIASFLVMVMLSAASISAVAFAMTAEESTDVYVPYAECAVVECAVVEEPYDYPVILSVVEESYDTSVIQDTAWESYGAETANDYIEIEQSSIAAGDVVAIYNAAGNHQGFPTLAAAIAASDSGATIFFLGNVTHPGILEVNSSVTLDFRGYNLTVGTLVNVVGAGTNFTVVNGGTIFTGNDGISTTVSPTVTINANIVAGGDGIRAGIGASTITVNGNITSMGTNPSPLPGGHGIRTLTGSTATIVVNGVVTANSGPTAFSGSGLYIQGSPSVTVNGSIDADSHGVYALAGGNSVITVIGNINSGASGIFTSGGSDITVEGNVNAANNGISAHGSSTTTLRGNITAATGISSFGAAVVNVLGDIAATAATGAGVSTSGVDSAQRISVQGNIDAQGNGISSSSAGSMAEIVIEGNVTAGENGINTMSAGNVSTIHVIGDVVAVGTGANTFGDVEVRITGAITAPEYLRIAGIVLAADQYGATSTLEGYRQFSRGNATVWVLDAEGQQPPACECTYTDCPCTGVPENCTCGTQQQPNLCEECGEYPCTCGTQLPTYCDECGEYPCVCLPYVPGGTQPAPTPPANDGDDANGDGDGDDGDERTAAGDRRDPAAGPETGDVVNWFMQIAVLAALVATFASVGLARTREQKV